MYIHVSKENFFKFEYIYFVQRKISEDNILYLDIF